MKEIWRDLVAKRGLYRDAERKFLEVGVDRASLALAGLQGDFEDKFTALGIIPLLTIDERLPLLDGLFSLSLQLRFGRSAARIIIELPRDSVLGRIESIAESYLPDADHLDYRMMLQLFAELDIGLAMKYARKASEASDYDIAEVGRDWIEFLSIISKETKKLNTKVKL